VGSTCQVAVSSDLRVLRQPISELYGIEEAVHGYPCRGWTRASFARETKNVVPQIERECERVRWGFGLKASWVAQGADE